MKKTKLISLILAALMIVSIIPMGIFSASADVPTTVPTMPTTLPDGTATNAKVMADFGGGTTNANNIHGTINGGFWEAKSTANLCWSTKGTLNNNNPLGASGLMFYYDIDGNAGTNDNYPGTFELIFVTNASVSGKGACRFTCSLKIGGATIPNKTINYYTNTGNGWETQTESSNHDYYIGISESAWYYIPFESFTYLQHGGSNATDDNRLGTSFADFLERYSSDIGVIQQIAIRAKDNSDSSVYFGDIYMVYPELEAASENAATAPLFPDLKISNSENVDADKAVMENGKVTISGALGNNTANTSNKRVWLNGSANANLSKANGIKFYVDSSSLKEDNAQLLLRIRLKSSTKPTDLKDYQLLTGALNGTASLTGASEIQFTTRSAGSTAFVENENGELVVACYGNTANLTESAQFHADTIALPAGYKGYVYIPMDSYFACLGGSNNNQPWVSFDTAAKLGVANAINGIAIVQTYSDDTNAANYQVSYSDFQVVYEDLEVTKVSATVGDDLSLKVFAATANGATITGATYAIDGGEAKAATVNDSVVTCDGILPQDAGKTVSITVNGKVGDVAVSATVATSIKEYCLKLINDSSASSTAKNLAADLLRYAFAAQKFASNGALSEEDYIIDTATASKIAALGTKTDFAQLSLTDGSVKTDSTMAGYDMTGAALRLENALAINISIVSPANNTETLKLTVSTGGAATDVAITDGSAVISNVSAADFSTGFEIKLYVGNTVVQTLTYKVNDYLANAFADNSLSELELDLVKALYDYGVSAAAYASAN